MKLTFTLIAVFAYGLLNAQKAGTLDSSFGTDGKVLTSSPTSYLQCFAVAAQSDGSIIATGNISSNDSAGFFAIRYYADGLIDPTFGVNGLAYLEDAGQAVSMAIQPDNKILIAGYRAELFGPYNISVARFNADGTIDATFGKKGIVLSNMGDRAYAIALQPDGKILIVGVHKDKALTMRFLSDGTPDITFGSNGVVETNFSLGGTSLGYAIAVQPDGKIVVGGRSNLSLFLGRYNTDGTFDEIFGSGGKVLFNIGTGVDAINDIVLQSDGKIIAVGIAASTLSDTLNSIVLRCLPDGLLDQNFGNAGISGLKFETKATLKSVILEKDGKIVTCGSINNVAGNSAHFLVERYTTDGSIDSSFATNGYQTSVLDSSDIAYSVFLQDDNKIVIGGGGTNTNETGPLQAAVVLARFNNDESRKQILIAKIRRWLQHHNGIVWDNMPGVKSYAVQRSADGIRWTTVHTQQVTANSQSSIINSQLSTVNYYNDPSPLPGTNYYLLQTTSVDGVVAYSNVIAINNEPSTISLSPNPTKNVLHIEGLSSSQNLPTGRQAKINVVDFAGNVAYSQQLSANSSFYNLNIASLKPGNYWLKVEVNGEVVIKQFVKE